MKKINMFAMMMLLIPFAANVNAGKNTFSTSALEIHPLIGSSIDLQENETYKIVANAPGLINVKFYENNEFRNTIHIIGNNKFPYAVVETVKMSKMDKLKKHIDNVSSASENYYFNSETLQTLEKLDQSPVVKIKLLDKNEFVGKITRVSPDTVYMETNSGLQLSIPDQTIGETSYSVSFSSTEEYFESDPNNTRLFLGPTARTLKSGHGYFTDFLLFFPTVAFGLSDNVMLGGGMTLIPGADEQMLYLAPKINLYHQKNFDLAAGALYFNIPDTDNASLLYTVFTAGDMKASFTGGICYGYADEKLTDEPLILVGGEITGRNNMKFITENWFYMHENVALYSFGVRFFRSKLSADLGFLTTEDLFTGGGLPLIPWVNFAIVW